jgi:hypothetical protein
MMSVSIGGGQDVTISLPQKLFDWGAAWEPFYDLAADGKRGVAAVPVGRAVHVQRISVVQNWQQQLGGR